MADKARLQVKTVSNPEKREDVGAGSVGVPVPVTIEGGVTLEVGANGLEVDVKASALPSGAATEAKQDSQITLETTLNSLIETIQEYSARVAAINAVITSGLPTLRVSGAVTATGGGYVTSAQVVAALLTQTKALEQYSANAVHSNINNVVVT